MSDTDTTDTGAAPTTGAAPNPNYKEIIAERDAAKERARAAEAKLAESEARIKSEQETREIELARKTGDFSTIEKDYQAKLAEKEKALADASAKLAEITRRQRESAMVDALAAKAGLPDRVMVEGLLRAAHARGLVDIAPEQIDDAKIVDTISKLRELSPSVFKSQPTGTAATAGAIVSGDDIPAEIAADPKRLAAYQAAQARHPKR